MHILLIHQAFVSLEEPGGTRHVEMARFLARRGHKVTIIASRVSYMTGKTGGSSTDAEDGEIGDQITIIRSYTYPALHKSFLHRVISFFSFMASSLYAGLKVRKVDLMWGTSPPIFQGLTALLLGKFKRIPFLFEVRDLWPAFAIDVGVLRNRFLILASEWLERLLYRNANIVVVNSPGFVEHVKSCGAERIRVIPNGSDPGMFNPSDDGRQFLEMLGLEGKFVALYAGAHGMSNDLGILLQAAEILRDCTEIAVVLLGDGKEKPNLQETAQYKGLNNVYFVPPLPKNEMSQALAAADVCIAILKPVPLYATVYPNKVFDYMAAGRPIVCAIDGEIRKVIEEYQSGIFVSPGDSKALAKAILDLYLDSILANKMGSNGRKAVENYFARYLLAEKLVLLMENLVDATK